MLPFILDLLVSLTLTQAPPANGACAAHPAQGRDEGRGTRMSTGTLLLALSRHTRKLRTEILQGLEDLGRLCHPPRS